MAGGFYDTSIRVWNITEGVIVKNIQKHKKMIRYLLTLSDDIFLSSSYDFSLKVWNSKNGTLLKNIPQSSTILMVNHLNEAHLVTGSENGLIQIWKVDNISLLNMIFDISSNSGRVRGLVSLKDGKFASAGDDGKINIWPIQDFI